MGPLVVMAGPTERDDPHGIEVIIVRVQRDRPKMVCMQLASLLTADAPITIAPKNCPPQKTPPRVTIDRAPKLRALTQSTPSGEAYGELLIRISSGRTSQPLTRQPELGRRVNGRPVF